MGHNWMSMERVVFEEWRLPGNSAERAKEAENDQPITLTWWIVFWVSSHCRRTFLVPQPEKRIVTRNHAV
jgi:hypothetical protein